MSEAKDLTEIRKQIQQRSAEQKLTRRSTMSVPEMRKLLGLKKTDSCRMRRICLGFHGKNWQKSQGAKKLEDFWIPPSAIIKGGSQERVFSYSLMLRMYITSWMMGMNRKKIQYPWR